jgi:DNA-binding SARP family transcriptional activator
MGTAHEGRDLDATGVAPQPVRLSLLSGFELVVDGATIDVPSSAQRVVAYLAIHKRSLPRALVASSLWLDVTEERAAANLRAALWKLRDVRDRVVIARVNRLSLAAQVAVDVTTVVEEARGLLDAGRTGAAPDSDELPPEQSAADLDLLSRDLLPGWDDDWILLERERLRQLRIHAIEALSDRLRRCGRHAEAVEAGLSAVAADPLRESAQRVLIEAHLAESNVADARRQFEAFRRLLRDELGVAPSPVLSRLVGLSSPDGPDRHG